MTNYISRKKPQKFFPDNFFAIGELKDILESDYSYILDAINDEDYFIDGDIYQIFKEIVYDNKVVGFATYDIGNDDFITLINIYVLPEFRGNQLFLNEIKSWDVELIIKDPTKEIIEILLHYNLANEISDTLIHSNIKLQMNQLSFISDKNVEFDNLDALVYTNLYDLKLDSLVYVCNLYNDDENIVYYEDQYVDYDFDVNEYLADIEKTVLNNIDKINKIKHVLTFEEIYNDTI